MTSTDSLTLTDRQHIQARGIAIETVQQQLAWFQKGFPYVHLDRPCTVGDGIIVLAPQDMDRLTSLHNRAARAGRVMKFVPASGAASRMFQSLSNLNGRTPPLTRADLASAADAGDRDSQQFLHLLAQFPQLAFAADLRQAMAQDGISCDEVISHGQYHRFLSYLLTAKGLNYANLPKGLIQFHRYADHTRTPLEEHLVEASEYARDGSGVAHLHFTVPLEHREAISAYLQSRLPRYEQPDCHFRLTFSVQKAETDTIAVDQDNKPFHDVDGQLVFRPGGHGALLENLSDLQGDIIFIKNIDNVVPDRLKTDTYRYKKALGGYLIALQQELFTHLERLTQSALDSSTLAAAMAFAQTTLLIHLPKDLLQASLDDQRTFLIQRLHRPIRVCGMVRNTGEPGGGPFWVQKREGSLSRQIIESSQVEMQAEEQRTIWQTATHFNPVDLVCGVRDFRGVHFDLSRFTDPTTGFISIKSKDGRELRALELPGLWNGAMAEWHTIFVEVPLMTFNPVKTVYDLLRPEHQGQ